MLSRRLIQKLEALSDDAQAHIERHIDVLLTMPERRRRDGRRLRLVPAQPPLARVSLHRAVAASQAAIRGVQGGSSTGAAHLSKEAARQLLKRHIGTALGLSNEKSRQLAKTKILRVYIDGSAARGVR